MAGQILNKVQPIYPADARASHISGSVVLHAIIGKDGHVAKLEAISGPEELRGAAMDAVNQWTYKPYLLNGEPTEVDTTIVINFNINPSSQTGQTVHDEPGSIPVRVTGSVSGGSILSKVPLIYPPDAKAARVEGTVEMKAIIGKDGHVKDLVVVSGPEILQPAALEAVRQWVYNPYLLNGEPVEVDTRIVVNFNLNSPDAAPQTPPQ
jgi:TonB family protein